MEAPEFFQGSSYCSQFVPKKTMTGDHFIVEDLLDFSNKDAVIIDGTFDSSVAAHSTDFFTVTIIDSCNSPSFSGCELNLAGDTGYRGFIDDQSGDDLCVPFDDLAELEWLSTFVEESFSSEDLEKLQLISGMKTQLEESSQTRGFQSVLHNQVNNIIDNGDNNHVNNNNLIFHPDMLVPAKVRSKRSRVAPCNWASRLLILNPSTSSSENEIVVQVQPPPSHYPGKKPVKTISSKRKDGGEGGGFANSDGRKCLHCTTDKTPQWRTGPMGPKTLRNACGVRYKSGRLVPEYRPAASPTSVLTKHSNSHRKVLELRRQKELARAQQHHYQNMVFDHVSNGDDYLIHQPSVLISGS